MREEDRCAGSDHRRLARIGRATALELSRGHHVIATARHIEALSDLTTGARLRLDVTDQPFVDAAIAAAGQIDVLVSNAGETLRAPVESVPLHEVERLFQLNTLGAAGDPGRASRDALPRLWPDRVPLQRAETHRAPAAQRLRREQMGAGGDRRTLAIEAGSFGIKVSILQPSGVSSDGAERAPVHPAGDDPYHPLLAQLAATRSEPVTPDEVARLTGNTLDDPSPRLRIAVGEPARGILARRKASPDDQPFHPARSIPRPG